MMTENIFCVGAYEFIYVYNYNFLINILLI